MSLFASNDKYSIWKQRLNKEVNSDEDPSEHFLYEFLNWNPDSNGSIYITPFRKRINYPQGNTHTYRVPKDIFKSGDSTLWMQNAIRATYDDYDIGIDYDVGDITKMVWYRFKEAIRHVSEDTENLKKTKAKEKAKKAKQEKIERQKKKQAKEDEEYRRLGGGNMDLGRKRFNERMKKDRAASRKREKDVPIPLLNEFKQWLKDNPNWDDISSDVSGNDVTLSTTEINENSWKSKSDIHMYVPKIHMNKLVTALLSKNFDIINGLATLRKLCNIRRNCNATAKLTIKWPQKKPDGLTNEYEYGAQLENGWSNYTAKDRESSPLELQVCGMNLWNIYKRLILQPVTNTSISLPIRFKKCADMVKPKSIKIRKCFKCPTYNCEFTHLKFDLGYKILTLESQNMTNKESNNWLRFFTNTNNVKKWNSGRHEWYLNCAMMIFSKDFESIAKVDNINAQDDDSNYSSSSSTSARQEELNTVDQRIRKKEQEKRDARREKSKLSSVEKLDALQKLCEMHKNGYITDKEFKRMKKQYI
jgi:hypothetical protein